MRPLVGTTAALLCLGSAAAAYVLDATAVFRQFGDAQARSGAQAAHLVGTAAIGPSGGGAARAVPFRLDLSFPGACRLEIDRPGNPESIAYRGEKVTSPGPVDPAISAFASLACPALVLRGMSARAGQAAIAAFAARLAVDRSTVSLARYRRRATFAVGAKPRDLNRPQIWFDQRSGLPVRIIGTAAGKLWDVRFVDPRSLATGRAAPRRIRVFQAQREALEVDLMTPAPAEGPTTVGDTDGSGSPGD